MPAQDKCLGNNVVLSSDPNSALLILDVCEEVNVKTDANIGDYQWSLAERYETVLLGL